MHSHFFNLKIFRKIIMVFPTTTQRHTRGITKKCTLHFLYTVKKIPKHAFMPDIISIDF